MRLSSVPRWLTRCAAGLFLAALVVGPAAANPPLRTNTGGKSLDEWLNLWFTWALGGDQPDHVGKVQFLPLPAGEPVDDGAGTADDPVTLAGEIAVTVKPGTRLVFPLAGWIREVYLDGSVDPFLPDEVFTGSRLVLKVDGRTVLNSRRDDLCDYYVPPTALDEPVFYPEPTPYGSVGTVGFQAIGVILGPLSAGEHTIELRSEVIAAVPDPDHPVNTGFRYRNTWTVTVRN